MAHENGNLPRINTIAGVLFYTQDQHYNPKTCTEKTVCLGCGHPVDHNGVMFIVKCKVCETIDGSYR